MNTAPLQTNTTPTGGNISLDPERVGPIGRGLHDLGVPYYAAIGAVLTFVVVSLLLYAITRATVIPLVGRVLDARGVEDHVKRPLQRLTKTVVGFVVVAVAFRIAGYGNIFVSLATVAAAATLAIGLALQNVLGNFVAGVFIYTDRPFRIGDWIEWGGPDGGYSGTVEDITFRVTRVRSFDNELLTVPNSVLTDGVIKNPVAKDELRLNYTFGIGYEDDIDQATEIINEEAKRHPDILADPAPTVRMSENPLADSYVGLVSRFWIGNPSRADFLRIRTEYITAVKERFDDAGIDIPYPQVDLTGSVDFAGDRRFESTE